MPIQVVPFGTITTGTSMQPFWVRWTDLVLKPGADGSGGAADYDEVPFPLTDGEGQPIGTGNLTLVKGGTLVRDMELVIPDPDGLSAIDPVSMATRDGEVGWSYAVPADDFATASPTTAVPAKWDDNDSEHYALQARIELDSGLILAPPTVWVPEVADGPATLALTQE